MDASAKMADSTFIQCHLQADGQSYPTLPQHIYHKARHETHYRKVMVMQEQGYSGLLCTPVTDRALANMN